MQNINVGKDFYYIEFNKNNNIRSTSEVNFYFNIVVLHNFLQKMFSLFFYSHSCISGRKTVPNNYIKIPLLPFPCFFCAFHHFLNLLFHRCSHTGNRYG